jgi:uncharacterized repeat protein (TIGR01451 family)
VTATVSGDAGEQNLSNNCDTDCDKVVVPPMGVDLCISQCNGICDCAPPGATICYTLTICNICGTTATGVLVKDTIPPGSDFVSASDGGSFNSATGIITWPTFSLNAGDCVYRSFRVRVQNPVPSGITDLVNFATVTDDGTHGPDKCDKNNKTCLITPICKPQNPDVCITKHVDFPCITLGTDFTYTLTVSTLNSVGITGGLVRDTIPANTTFVSASNNGTFANGVVTFPLFDLAGNSSVSGTITLHLNATVPNGVNSITNVITVTDDGTHGPDVNTANNTYTLVTPICTQQQNPNLMITKSIDVPCVTPGNNVTYTLTISSLNSVATTGVIVTDTIPANMSPVSASDGGTFFSGVFTFPAFSLGGNASTTRTIVLRAGGALPTYTNVATVTDDGTHGPDTDTSNNTFTLTTPLCTQNPDLMITKTVNPPCVTPGTNLTYTLTVSSLNSVSTTGVIVKDTIPANTTFVSASDSGTFAGGVVTFPAFSLTGNSSATRTVVVLAAATFPAGVTSVTNVATVTDDGTHGQDLNPNNNTFTLTTPLCGQTPPDLMITKRVDVPCVTLGANLTYTLTISSLNSVATTGVLVTDTIPANTTFVSASDGGVFTAGTVLFPTFPLGGNASVTRTVVVTAAATLPAGVTSFTNVATVEDDHTHGADLNPTNNRFTLTTPVCTTNGPDLAIEQMSQQVCANTSTLVANFVYTLKISETGGLPLTGVVVTDTIPPNSTFVSASNGGTFAGGVVTFPAFDLAAATTALRTVTVSIPNPLPRPTAANLVKLTNTVTATAAASNGTDVNPASNTSTVTDTLSNLHFVSDISANPRPIVAGALETFTAVAADDANPSLPITYTWTFGDGTSTTTTATTVFHTYAASGSYLITVTADNGIGCPLAEQLQTQQPPPGGGQAVCQLFRAPFSLVRPNADSLTLVAQLTLPKGFNPAGHRITIDIAQFQFNATLDARGNGVNLPKNQIVKVKPNGDFSVVSLKITKSNLRALLAPGVPPTATAATVPNQLFFIGFDIDDPNNADTFSDTQDIKYKSNKKAGVISF